MDRSTQRTCLITGGNAGIGKEAAVQIAAAGYRVVLACRSLDRGEAALDEIRRRSSGAAAELKLVDMSRMRSVRELAAAYLADNERLEVLVHNAAAFDLGQRQRAKTDEGIETIWATNHLGPVLLTHLLLDALQRSGEGRVLTVSSKGLLLFPRLRVDLADPEFEERKWTVSRAYYQSKLAQVIYTHWLAEQLASTKVTVNCVRVPNVRIDISRYPGLSAPARLAYAIKSRFAISPAEMAKTYAHLATSTEVRGVTGRCFDERARQVGSSRSSRDPDHLQAVMQLTLRHLGLTAPFPG